MGVVINCMGKGKEDSPTYMYTEIYTQLEGGEKTTISTDTFCVMGKGKEGSPNVHVHRDLHTARRRGKNNDQHRYMCVPADPGKATRSSRKRQWSTEHWWWLRREWNMIVTMIHGSRSRPLTLSLLPSYRNTRTFVVWKVRCFQL